MSAPTTTYDLDDAVRRHLAGASWRSLAAEYGVAESGLRRRGNRAIRERSGRAVPGITSPEAEERTRSVRVKLPATVTNLEELIRVLQVDTDEWSVKSFLGNGWMGQTAEGLEQFLQVKAQFERNPERTAEYLRQIAQDCIEDMREHAPTYPTPPAPVPLDGDPVLYTVHIYDPHLGMLSWGPETGADYDIKIARSDFARAGAHLLSLGWLYPIDRVLIVLGNDMQHVDTAGLNGRGGATTKGTPQDTDGRRAKQFTTARKVSVDLIDRALNLGRPVDVELVPGNHDRDQTYRLGEVLSAWYRNVPLVTVTYGPAKRSFYGYGQNAFMLTHGEEYRRQRDSLPLIFATECPAELWVRARYREILTGHNHVNLVGRYLPTSDQNETRGIRTRSLPGLTPEDAWHTEEGYRHVRSATAIAYRRSGGVAGLHEFNLWNEEGGK